jgi:dihydroorotate dehydrogenase (NAD+) catalytic subunit
MPRPAINLRVELAPENEHGLSLRNPVLVASGTFGYGVEYARLVDVHRLGAIVCKGTTIDERDGSLPPRIVETAAGMLNSIGLQNRGIAALLRDFAPKWARWSTPVVVNIAAEALQDYADLAFQLDGVPGIAAIEVNISCPNLDNGSIPFASNPQSAAEVTRAVVEATSLPVIVKLSPNVGDIVAIAVAVEAAGADAISLINTVLGMAIDITTRQPTLGARTGGLSGPAIKPLALRMVWQVAQAVSIPIIGIGGIASPADALEFLMAGATAVQVGSATFTNPRAALDVLDGLSAWLHAEGIEDVHDIIGAALPAAAKD